ncbi:hypothetical protein PTSG_02859 [Salpingoeca rosetta]|uniref:NOD3 protein n=1 Tax=Salpingoeca rosetta (strain ATCC 50818 / BSB-021) TaxID=946362 RepID=F2U3J3_SALR5|nr:uncharacterized protein PTSG_02859 [Salpingoeca rosetta]EGD82187.1 hypothetical protein PTSG_02859 [Salpingoeca rosetta]|eukprot:XP_004996370.1 hypothetical protein PTSG_02859 [Salpingoeca rosetta]
MTHLPFSIPLFEALPLALHAHMQTCVVACMHCSVASFICGHPLHWVPEIPFCTVLVQLVRHHTSCTVNSPLHLLTASALPYLPSCRFLGTDLGDSWACAMAEALKWNTRLKRLEIHHGRISTNGAEALAAALKRNSSVTTLCLHCNAIGPDGAVAFADMFRHNTSITHLSLGDNAIGDDGALALATVLGQGNSTLQGLWIWKNGLTDKAAMALAGMLTRNHTLTQLGVQDNCIGPEGGEALGTALGSNDSLQLLWLHKNTTATAHAFGAALPAGRRIDTGDWSEDDTGKAAFMEARRMR